MTFPSHPFRAEPLRPLRHLTMKKIVLSVALTLAATVCAAAEVAAPFGIELGRTTCAQALIQLRAEYQIEGLNRLGWTVVRVKEAGWLYQGAIGAELACSAKDKPVHYVIIKLNEGPGGIGVTRAVEELKKRYALLDGDIVNGRGAMHFKADSADVDVTADAIDTFTIEYMTPEVAARKRARPPEKRPPARL